jgi:hypothetical protein
MPLGRPLPQYSYRPRPWRGPLPRPRLAAVLTLEAFMPVIPPRVHKPDYPRDRGATSEVIVKGVLPPEASRSVNPTSACALDSAVITLISKAKAYGRSRSCLTQLNHGKAMGKLSPAGGLIYLGLSRRLAFLRMLRWLLVRLLHTRKWAKVFTAPTPSGEGS